MAWNNLDIKITWHIFIGPVSQVGTFPTFRLLYVLNGDCDFETRSWEGYQLTMDVKDYTVGVILS